MKKLLALFLAVQSFPGLTQTINWDAAITIAASSYGNLHPRISLDRNGNPLVLWGSSNNKAQFARWNGTSFTMPVSLNPGSIPAATASWMGPNIASYGDTVYVVFKKTPEADTLSHVYIVSSFDGGQNFSMPVRVSYISDSVARLPTVTTDNAGNPIIAFMKFNASFGDARFAVSKSNDFGTSFSPDVKASGFSGGEICDCCPATLLNSGSRTIMLYRDNLSNKRTIWAGISNDNGNSFTSGVEVDNTNWMISSCPSSGPDGVIVGDTLYSVFRSSASGTRVYFSKASLNTPTLVSAGQVTQNFSGLSSQDYPRIAHAGNAAVMAWRQVSSGNSKACISFTTDIRQGFPVAYDSIGSNNVTNLDIAMREGEIHLVWQNDATGSVSYRKGTYATTSVGSISSSTATIMLFPNPATSHFIIPIKSAVKCLITDVNGQASYLPIINSQVSVKGLASGIYSVHIEDKTGKKYSSKIVIE